MRPLSTEKAIMRIEAENVLTFEIESKKTKTDLKKEIEKIFDIKIDKIRTNTRGNKKYAYVKLNPNNLAIDVATKLGMM